MNFEAKEQTLSEAFIDLANTNHFVKRVFAEDLHLDVLH